MGLAWTERDGGRALIDREDTRDERGRCAGRGVHDVVARLRVHRGVFDPFLIIVALARVHRFKARPLSEHVERVVVGVGWIPPEA